MKKIIILALSMTILLSSCEKKEETLNIYFWGNFFSDEVIAEFEEETGITVNYDTFLNNDEMIKTINENPEKYDIITPNNNKVELLIEEDRLLPIEYNLTPNTKYLLPVLQNVVYDVDNKYNVPYVWGTVGLIYNDKKVEKPNSWSVLFNEEYAGKILMNEAVRENMGITLKYLGFSANTTDFVELDKARTLLLEQREFVYYAGTDLAEKMIENDIYYAVGFSGDATKLASESDDFKYVIPKEGSHYWISSLSILKNTSNAKNAHLFIDYVNRPEIAKKLTEYHKLTTTNEATINLLDKKYTENDAYYINLYNYNMELIEEVGNFLYNYKDIMTEVINYEPNTTE